MYRSGGTASSGAWVYLHPTDAGGDDQRGTHGRQQRRRARERRGVRIADGRNADRGEADPARCPAEGRRYPRHPRDCDGERRPERELPSTGEGREIRRARTVGQAMQNCSSTESDQ
jgi:hypothetical protein